MFRILLLILLVLWNLPLGAQELPPPGEEIDTSILDEEPYIDPSLNSEGKPEAKIVETESSIQDDEEDSQEFTHTVNFDFVSRVSFTRMGKKADDFAVSAPPYMEVEYRTQWEKNINLSKGKGNIDVEATYSADHWGSLIENEFFSCRLEINIDKMPFKGSLTIKTEKDEDDNETYKLLGKVDIARDDFKEDWFSFCTQGSYELNTKGDTEDYNYQILKMIEPSLTALSVENYDPTDTTRIDLVVEPHNIDDYEIDAIVTLAGSGTLTLETY